MAMTDEEATDHYVTALAKHGISKEDADMTPEEVERLRISATVAQLKGSIV